MYVHAWSIACLSYLFSYLFVETKCFWIKSGIYIHLGAEGPHKSQEKLKTNTYRKWWNITVHNFHQYINSDNFTSAGSKK
jgi:hypothetical protein